jgi:hypothetical protein
LWFVADAKLDTHQHQQQQQQQQHLFSIAQAAAGMYG